MAGDRATGGLKGGRAIANRCVEEPERNVPEGKILSVTPGHFEAHGLDIGSASVAKRGVGSNLPLVRKAYEGSPGSEIVIRGSMSRSKRIGRTDADLPLRRAKAFKEALIEQGVPPASIRIETGPTSRPNHRAIGPNKKAMMRGATMDIVPSKKIPRASDGFTDNAHVATAASPRPLIPGPRTAVLPPQQSGAPVLASNGLTWLGDDRRPAQGRLEPWERPEVRDVRGLNRARYLETGSSGTNSQSPARHRPIRRRTPADSVPPRYVQFEDETVASIIRPIAIAPPRSQANTEDLEYGTDEDPYFVYPQSLVRETDEQLFSRMRNLFYFMNHGLGATGVDFDLVKLTDSFIGHFRGGSGSPFSHATLNRLVSEHPNFKKIAGEFNREFAKRIKDAGGDLSKVTPFRLSKRPIFDDRFGGLQIFVNDTESTQIYTTDFGASGGKWTAEFKFVIRDHFGLDVRDVLKFQRRPMQQDFVTGVLRHVPQLDGFPAWWLLQHTRGYAPFETIMIVTQRMSGNL
jgi:Protein of unknown function (DUF3289)